VDRFNNCHGTGAIKAQAPNGFVLKLLTFVSTVSFWPFWGLMHLGMRKWRG